MREPIVENFSSEYAIVQNSQVRKWTEDFAVMDEELYDFLLRIFGEPIVGLVDGIHYSFKPTYEVPAYDCAIPKDGGSEDPSALLVHK